MFDFDRVVGGAFVGVSGDMPRTVRKRGRSTVLTFSFTLHAGVEGSVEQVINKTAVYSGE